MNISSKIDSLKCSPEDDEFINFMFQKLRREITRLENAELIESEDIIFDHALNGVVTAWNLVDFFQQKESPSANKNQIRNYRDNLIEQFNQKYPDFNLGLLHDYATTYKHMKVSYPKSVPQGYSFAYEVKVSVAPVCDIFSSDESSNGMVQINRKKLKFSGHSVVELLNQAYDFFYNLAKNDLKILDQNPIDKKHSEIKLISYPDRLFADEFKTYEPSGYVRSICGIDE